MELADVTLLLPTRRATRALQEAFLRPRAARALLLPRIRPGEGSEDLEPVRRRARTSRPAPRQVAPADQQAAIASWCSPSWCCDGPRPSVAAAGRRPRSPATLPRVRHAGPGCAAGQGAGPADGHDGDRERRLRGACAELVPEDVLRALGADAGVSADRHRVLAGASRRARLSSPMQRASACCCAEAQAAERSRPGAGHRRRRDGHRSGGDRADRAVLGPAERRARAARARPERSTRTAGTRSCRRIPSIRSSASTSCSTSWSMRASRCWPLPGDERRRRPGGARVAGQRGDAPGRHHRALASVRRQGRPRARDGEALPGVAVLEAANAEDEAEAIALILRKAVETPGRTAALVSPDRALARRVAARLEAWGMHVVESAGQPSPRRRSARFWISARSRGDAVRAGGAHGPAQASAVPARHDGRGGAAGARALELACSARPTSARGWTASRRRSSVRGRHALRQAPASRRAAACSADIGGRRASW